jgi:arylesterase/paraoxonase
VLVALVVVGGMLVLDFLGDAGVFAEIEPHFDGDCRAVAGAVGAEDIVVDRERRVAYLSSFDRRAAARGEAVEGAIFAFDLTGPNAEPVPLATGFGGELRPHGISLWQEEGEAGGRLFVVNHPEGGHTIEIFAVRGDRLEHVETIRDELLVSPNDVAAVGPRQFYVTNDHGNRTPLGRTIEDYGRLRRSNVVHYDGERARVVADGIAYANGVNVSPAGDEVYVAATTGRAILRYDRDPSTGELALAERIDVGTGVDNIDVDRHGNLWVAAHPQLLRFVAHAGDAAERSPSQVLWLEALPRQGGVGPAGERFLETYLGDGGELSGSSVAVAVGSRLLIGSVFEQHFLLCQRR